MQEEIADLLPELRTMLPQLSDRISLFQGFSLQGAADVVAVPLVTTQAVNDFVDGLSDCTCGRGRQALRATRSLFETTITFLDVVGNQELRDRYMAYREIVDSRSRVSSASRRDLGTGAWAKARLLRRRHSKTHVSIEQRASKQFGKAFLRNWHPSDMRTRSKAHGLEEEYGFYQLSSAVLHGSAAGYVGLTADIGGSRVHRIGPALALTIVALPKLLSYFIILLRSHSDEYKGGRVVDDLIESVSEFQSLVPRFRKRILRLDKAIWPEEPPPGPVYVAVIDGPDALVTWYFHDMQAGLMCQASAPAEKPPQLETLLDSARAQILESATRGPLSIVYLGHGAEPVPEAPWVPDTEILGRLRQQAGS